MASSRPALRTYVKKRKETAEEKYDAIFGPKSRDGVETTVESPKRRRILSSNKSHLTKSSQGSPSAGTGVKNTASEKFDAVSKSNGKLGGNLSMAENHSYSDDEDKSFEITRSRSQFSSEDHVSSPDEKMKERTKYDVMYEKNEKAASDKFDALFGESEHISKPKRSAHWNNVSRNEQSKLMDDLASFNSWEDDSESENSAKTSPQKPTSPTKLPHITHASMVKVGGKLVLNIQRGGNTNSLVEKGGTMLVSPVEKSKPSLLSHPQLEMDFDEPNSPKKTVFITTPDTSDQSKPKIAETKWSYTKLSSPNMTKNTLPSTKKLLSNPGKKVSRPNVSYNPRPWASQTKGRKPSEESDALSSSQPSQLSTTSTMSSFDEFTPSAHVPKLKKSVTWPKNVGESIVTSVKCDKKHQQYFTVVKHVKNYQNCLEEGEIQEFEDEVLYLQEGLTSNQPISVRCLSVTSLACKCEQQNFRLYLRAHNVLTKIFDTLQAADENKALSLATSSLLYMLSRDRQIDIDKATLRILLKLVDPLEKNRAEDKPDLGDKSSPVKMKYSRIHGRTKVATNIDEEVDAVKDKIKHLIDRCGDPLVTSKDLSTKILASEALLRYTARRTSEWYREEIRLKGGLDHVIGLVKNQVDIIETLPAELDCCSKLFEFEKPLCTLERLLRVLENGIINSARNAMYLVTHQRALLLKKITLLMTMCNTWLHQTHDAQTLGPDASSSPRNKALIIIKNVITQIIKLLVNISNDSEWSSTRIGDQEGLLYSILSCILHIPKHLNEDHRYEILLLSLGLLVNLVESSAKNRIVLMQMKTYRPDDKTDMKPENAEKNVLVVEALVQLFIDREVAARQNEILGEDGVKRAAEAKRMQLEGAGYGQANKPQGSIADNEGYWVENDEGMEWVSVKSNGNDHSGDGDDLPSSQGSHRSIGDPQNIEATLTSEEKAEMKQALEKANDHMEASIIASYTALVLGCLIHGNRMNSDTIRSFLANNGDLSPMITMLKKFLSFMNLTHGMSKKGEQKLTQVIEDMEEINMQKFTPVKPQS